jgi:peptidoglycan pentaglycine glycine transferase (the first glycine)
MVASRWCGNQPCIGTWGQGNHKELPLPFATICGTPGIFVQIAGLRGPIYAIIAPETYRMQRNNAGAMNTYKLQPMAADQQPQWDRFVNDHPRGHFLQSWGWGELKASAGWHPLRLALWDETRGQMIAAAQILLHATLCTPLWLGNLAYIPKGPVIDWSQPEVCGAFFTQLNAFLRKHGTIALRMEPPLEVVAAADDRLQDSMAALPCTPVAPVQPARTIMLDLAPDPETLLAQMKEKWRYNVRLAGRKGVTVREARSEDDVRAWYALLQTTGERDRFGIHTLDYYLRCWQIFAPRGQLCLFLAEHDRPELPQETPGLLQGTPGHPQGMPGRPQGDVPTLLGGIFVALFARQAIYLYGASSNEQRQLMPNYLLQWRAICWAREQGAASYDFWGIPATDDENEPMAGVYRFKSGWGGRVTRFVGDYEHVYRPLAMRLVRRYLP